MHAKAVRFRLGGRVNRTSRPLESYDQSQHSKIGNAFVERVKGLVTGLSYAIMDCRRVKCEG
jgi:hypothetical protein